MTKKLFFSAALALTLAGGAAATASTAPAVALAPAAAQVVPAAPIAAAAVAQGAPAVQLTAAQMATVQGAGLFSWLKKQFKKVVKKIFGTIVSILRSLFSSWTVTITVPTADGGQTDEQDETVTHNYNTQADYDAGNASSTATEQGAWVTTSSWGGGGGCGGGDSGGLNYVQDIQAESVSTC